jgi:Lrp/AsnC family leucine-responsive transcriptional regulator
MLAFAFVRTEHAFEEAALETVIATIPEVQEMHRVAGEDEYILKLRVPDTEALGSLLSEKLDPIEALHVVRTTVVLKTVKETSTAAQSRW